jgi:hypothetical protein
MSDLQVHLPSSTFNLLEESRSERYASLIRDKGTFNEAFFNHGLLPLEILKVEAGGRLMCNCCMRSLSIKFFSGVARRLVAKRKCSVCRAIDIQISLHTQWDKDDED